MTTDEYSYFYPMFFFFVFVCYYSKDISLKQIQSNDTSLDTLAMKKARIMDRQSSGLKFECENCLTQYKSQSKN